MNGFLRGSLLLLALAATVVLVADVLSDGPAGTVSAELVATLIGSVALIQLLAAFGRRWPHIWARREPLAPHPSLERRGHRPAAPPIDAVRELDALLVAATTGGSRGRERLARRLDRLAAPSARAALDDVRSVPPAHLLAAVERFASEVEATHDD